MILEKHFNDPNCIFSKIKHKFSNIIVKYYSEAGGPNVKIAELVDGINQFMTILKEAVIDFYNLNTFA
jgi:hypothetical protein